MEKRKLERALEPEAAVVKKSAQRTPRERKAYLAAHPQTKMDLEWLEKGDRSGHLGWRLENLDFGEDRSGRLGGSEGDVEHYNRHKPGK